MPPHDVRKAEPASSEVGGGDVEVPDAGCAPAAARRVRARLGPSMQLRLKATSMPNG
jgi:hypothetical protein